MAVMMGVDGSHQFSLVVGDGAHLENFPSGLVTEVRD
jgi:hypothetical protein